MRCGGWFERIWMKSKIGPACFSSFLLIFTKVFTCRAHVQNGDLTEVTSCLQRSQHRSSVVGDDLQPSPVHYVHLFTHLACGRIVKVSGKLWDDFRKTSQSWTGTQSAITFQTLNHFNPDLVLWWGRSHAGDTKIKSNANFYERNGKKYETFFQKIN